MGERIIFTSDYNIDTFTDNRALLVYRAIGFSCSTYLAERDGIYIPVYSFVAHPKFISYLKSFISSCFDDDEDKRMCFDDIVKTIEKDIMTYMQDKHGLRDKVREKLSSYSSNEEMAESYVNSKGAILLDVIDKMVTKEVSLWIEKYYIEVFYKLWFINTRSIVSGKKDEIQERVNEICNRKRTVLLSTDKDCDYLFEEPISWWTKGELHIQDGDEDDYVCFSNMIILS